MHVERLECVSCERTYPSDQIAYECECGGSLDVVYDYDEIGGKITWELLRSRDAGHHRYRELLPVIDRANLTTLGAGGTPLLRSKRLGPDNGLSNLWFKMESQNPTGSFKDRGTAVELGVAMDHGADEIVVASTGNMGASIAAYTARAGVTANIYVPKTTTGPKRKQMESHGAQLQLVDGDYNLAAQQAWSRYEDDGIYLMGDYPYRGEGEKTIGHEIADQCHARGIAPATVVTPVGNGTLIHGTWKGLWEMDHLGLVAGTPRMMGVQAAGCNTVVKALQKGYDRPQAVEHVDTIAGAIACGDPLDGDQAMDAITDSSGFGTAVTDDQIREAKAELAEQEGIYAEEAAAAAWAGIKQELDRFDPDEHIICVICGHGLKT